MTEAEIRTGIAFLPEGRCRWGLAEAAERAFGSLFAGRPISQTAGQIAAIAISHGMSVAARSVQDFADMGLRASSMGRCMTETTEVFSRLRIDGLLKDAGWTLIDVVRGLFGRALLGGSQ